jgi:prepilin-type processing-associated H-X9-DG protein
MSIDLSGGIDPAREYMFAQRPDNPEMRDSVSFWVVDDRGEVGLPRIGIEAVAANWDAHDVQVNIAFADGRVFRLRENGRSWPAEGPDGRPTVLGAGGLAFRCVEPFGTWTMTFDGKAVQTSSFDLVRGKKDGPLVDVSFAVEATMAVPPWVQGALSAESASALKTSVEGDYMGGPRYEQLFRASGSVKVGDEERTFTGTGLRIRRQGVRRLAGFWGHAWQSALFPSGRAFGYIAYPPRPDGQPTFNEGYLFDGSGGLIPARVVEAPWLTRLQPLGEDVPVVLETDAGTVRIEGETVLSTHDIYHDDKMFSSQALKQEMPSFPALQQAGVRYRWDGEETFGMLERSSPLEKILRD